ncbi:MAG: hypothetical protein ACRDSR_26980 [Pseudonocardiaceae bacterium]
MLFAGMVDSGGPARAAPSRLGRAGLITAELITPGNHLRWDAERVREQLRACRHPPASQRTPADGRGQLRESRTQCCGNCASTSVWILCRGGMGAAVYIPRLADVRLSALLEELPAVIVTGPRAAGKTTSARRLAAEVLRLDQPSVAAAVRADPDAALRRAAARCCWTNGRKSRRSWAPSSGRSMTTRGPGASC